MKNDDARPINISHLLKMLKKGAIALIILITLFALIALTPEILREYEDYVYQQEANKVSIKADIDKKNSTCPSHLPFFYTITNQSSQVVEGVGFDIEVRQKGFSNTLIRQYIRDYKILKPGEYIVKCFAIEIKDNDIEKLAGIGINDIDIITEPSLVEFKNKTIILHSLF